MSVLKNFKNIPRSLYGRRQGSNVIFFFFKFATKSLEKKKEGACHPLGGDRGLPFYLSPGRHSPPFPLLFEPKNSGKREG